MAVVVRSIYGCRDHRECPFEGMYVFSSDAVVRSFGRLGRSSRSSRSVAREGGRRVDRVRRSVDGVRRSVDSTTRRLARHSLIDSSFIL